MAQQTERMQNLVNDLLALSRLENSPPPDFEKWVPVQMLLERCEADALALSAHITQGKEARRLLFPARADCGEIAGIASELQSAFFNLINNAIRYTPPGGHIEIRWERTPDGGGVFTVRDDGPGIAPEHIPRLTERFYRVDSSRSRESGGTGLGLAIVKHVLQRHDAVLCIDSTVGQGACFTAIFPPNRMTRLQGRDP
jgi:two-component system phosphate regulon sensor histidine kinase PhoR